MSITSKRTAKRPSHVGRYGYILAACSSFSPLRRLHHLDVRDPFDRAQGLFRRMHHRFDLTSDARYAFERDDVLVGHYTVPDWSYVPQRGGGGV